MGDIVQFRIKNPCVVCGYARESVPKPYGWCHICLKWLKDRPVEVLSSPEQLVERTAKRTRWYERRRWLRGEVNPKTGLLKKDKRGRWL